MVDGSTPQAGDALTFDLKAVARDHGKSTRVNHSEQHVLQHGKGAEAMLICAAVDPKC